MAKDIRDFYMRSESDPRFRPDQIEVYDEIEACINQVKMTLLTRKGEVLGEPQFGLQIEQYLFDFEIEPTRLSEEAQSQVTSYVTEAKKRNIRIEPGYSQDEKGREIFILKIDINGRRSPFAILYD
jgi:hypothetical protein